MAKMKLAVATWWYIIDVTGKHPGVSQFIDSEIVLEDDMDLVVAKERTQQYSLFFVLQKTMCTSSPFLV